MITLKPAEVGDIVACLGIAATANKKYSLTFQDSFEAELEICHSPKSKVLMILREGLAVGYVTYENNGSKRAYIKELIVHKDQSGQGIEAETLETLLLELIKDKFRVFTAHVHPEDQFNLEMYRRFLFKKFEGLGGTIDDFKETGEQRITMIRKL